MDNRADLESPLWRGWWRASPEPSVPLALGARSVGRADVQPGWQHGTGTIGWINLYWGEAGRVTFLVDDAPCVIPAGHLVLHPPGSRIQGMPVEAAGRYRWCTLDGPLSRATLEALDLWRFAPQPAGPCPTDLFDRLEADIRDVTVAGEYHASATLYQILARAAAGRTGTSNAATGDPLAVAAVKRMQADYADPGLNVDRLAADLHVHRSRLSRAVRDAVGVAPSVYLQRLRLRRGVELLRHGDMPVGAVARACGFADPAYFSRLVRRETGRPPRALRGTW